MTNWLNLQNPNLDIGTTWSIDNKLSFNTEEIHDAINGIDLTDKKQIASDMGISIEELSRREKKFEKVYGKIKSRSDYDQSQDQKTSNDFNDVYRFGPRLDDPGDYINMK